MAKSPASDSIMAPDKMKPLLAMSKREPVQAAIALSSDGEGLILLDKKAKPKKVASMLRGQLAKAKIQLNAATLRYGRAEVDTDYDAGMVRFFINKDAPGNMRVKLLEVIKKAAFQKVEINVDTALELEPEEDDEAEAAADAGAPTEALATAPPPAPPLPPSGSPDAAGLTAALSALIGQIARAAAGDAARRAQLSQLAADAAGKIKAADFTAAAEAIDRLHASLEANGGAAPQAVSAADVDVAALRKDLSGLIGRIIPAAGDDAARKAALAKLANDANGALKANDGAAATEYIARLRDALGRAPAGDDTAPVDDDQTTQLRERLNVCTTDLRQVADPETAAALTRSVQDIEALLKENKVGAAASMIDVLETQIGEAVRAARQQKVTEEAGHLVEFGKLLLRWRSAQATFDANLKALGTTLLARPDIQADPRIEAIEKAVAELPNLVPKFSGRLEDLLNDAISAAAAEEKKRLAAECIAAVDAYRQQLDAAAPLLALQQFAAKDLGSTLPLHGALDEALAELKQQLAA